jgi:hypothetical protein
MFYKENYLFLSMSGFLASYDLRFGNYFTWAEEFGSVLGLVSVVFVFSFPIFVSAKIYYMTKEIVRPKLTNDI